MEYICLKQQLYTDGKYSLTPLRHQDIFLIKKWRNEQIEVLRQKEPLTDAMQEHYFHNVITPLFTQKHPEQILLSFLLDGNLIGYGGIVHIDWPISQGEVSFLVETVRSKDEEIYNNDFASFLKLIKQLAFKDLHLHRLYTETFDIRPLHVAVLEEQGFHFEKRLKDHTFKNDKIMDSLIHGCFSHE
ncbi:MAG: GNAT family N-acetyltransferase [Parachlamydiaceae bacterium]